VLRAEARWAGAREGGLLFFGLQPDDLSSGGQDVAVGLSSSRSHGLEAGINNNALRADLRLSRAIAFQTMKLLTDVTHRPEGLSDSSRSFKETFGTSSRTQ